ncbi:hypothetical protein BOX15_Mlig018747g2 [Macrostomum lignano]|uniref:Uncharacterized protein n=1 Tax=Macrostomum lignano TaxID=282301 RepID=A0A267G1F1_9PLAT|nr:hypothetical protein BOX15_Mlig018747g2 [Macrostomum lignano]
MESQRKKPQKKQDRVKTYHEPSKNVLEATAESQRRVNERQKQQKQMLEEEKEVDIDKQQYEILIGQLKAAEARNRLRIMRMRYENVLEREVNHLISCQPTALRAVRLEAILPTRSSAKAQGAAGESGNGLGESQIAAEMNHSGARSGGLTKLDRSRIERLMST